MKVTRRTLLIGAGSGVVAVLLASCMPDEPKPSPTPTVSPAPSAGVPAPSGVLRSEWTTDPFARGGRVFVPAGSGEPDRAALAEPLLGRVFFAGEALGEPIGTLQSAAQDGLRAAAAVIDIADEGERILVVGAGAAGARAARTLVEAGCRVTVVEGRDRVGGRIRSVPQDDWPFPVQLGSWLAPEGSASLLADLEAAGIATHPLEGEYAADDDGETDVPSKDPITAAVGWAQSQPADVALADALVETGADPEDPAVAAALAALAAFSGADADTSSSWYPPTAADGPWLAAEGELDRLVADALGDVELSLSTTVQGIAYDENGVSLRLSTGEALSADRVVLTAPIGVLQHGSIEFEPALPFAYRGAIDAFAPGAVETVWLRFDEPFWETDAAVWHVVGGEAAIRTWINLAPATGEPVLVGLVGGEAARAFAELGEDDAAQAAVDSLVPFAAPAE